MADQSVNEDPEMQADQANIRCKMFHALSGLPLTARQQNCGSGVQTSFQRDRAFLYVAADTADMSIILTLSSFLAYFKHDVSGNGSVSFNRSEVFQSCGPVRNSQPVAWASEPQTKWLNKSH